MNKIKQFFCKHIYRIPKEYDDIEQRNEIISELESGSYVSFVRIHRCLKCNKEKDIGSGRIY